MAALDGDALFHAWILMRLMKPSDSRAEILFSYE